MRYIDMYISYYDMFIE